MKRILGCLVPLLMNAACLAAEAVPEATPTDQRGVYAVNGRLHVSLFVQPFWR